MCCVQQYEKSPKNTGGSQGKSRPRVCEWCEVAFKQRHRAGRYTQRFCSRRCAGFANAEAQRAQATPATCPVCHGIFAALGPDHRYCSPVCRRRARKRRRYEKRNAAYIPELNSLEVWTWE